LGTAVRSGETLRAFYQTFFHMSQEIKKQEDVLSVFAILWAILAK